MRSIFERIRTMFYFRQIFLVLMCDSFQEGHGPVVDVIGLAILQSAVWFEYFASGMINV